MSNTIIIKTQAELDALPDSFKDFTTIEIRGGTLYNRIIVRKARGSSHVVARESSHVEAWGSSHVEAWGSSHVEAWGSSHVVARGSVSVTVQSDYSTIELFCFAVAILAAKAKKIVQNGKNTTIIRPTKPQGTGEWLDEQGVKAERNKVILFKRVSADWKTQENQLNETVWAIGSDVELTNWRPKDEECGAGKLHACSRPYFCDEFRNTVGDKYIAIEIKTPDLYVWPDAQYPHKVAFRAGRVLYQCDRYGKQIS